MNKKKSNANNISFNANENNVSLYLRNRGLLGICSVLDKLHLQMPVICFAISLNSDTLVCF